MAKHEDAAERDATGPGRKFYVVLGVLAVAGVVALLAARGSGGPEPIGPLSQAELDVEADPDAYAAAKGPQDAPVTLIEFADYQCSHCAQFAALPGPALRRDYVQSGQVRMVLYDFPLRQAGNAIPAALAARCAGAQGQYWEMHDLLFAQQRQWAADQTPGDKFADYAGRVGLDVGRFNQCYSERRFIEEIMKSRRYGEQRGVTGTPAIYVNGTQARNYSYSAVKELIEAKLDSVGASAASAGSATGGRAVSGGSASSGPRAGGG